MSGELPALRDFVARYVESVDELEILAALAGPGTPADGEPGWIEVAALPALAKLDPAAVEPGLRALAARGAVGLSPDGARARLALDESPLRTLLAQYRSDPVAVLKLLNALAIQRLRSGATRAFADAFLLRRKDTDE